MGDDAAPLLAVVIHGALGSHRNWLRFARDLAEKTPRLRYALMDIRHHGESRGAPGPSTLAAAADDVGRLGEALGQAPDVVIGHSLGGKLAVQYAARQSAGLKQAWLLDSNPGPQATSADHEIYQVLAAVKAVAVPAKTREDVVKALEAAGISSGTSRWLATSLRRTDAGYDWTYELDAIEPLLADYFSVDLWPWLETLADGPDVHLVVAEESDRLIGDLRSRAFGLTGPRTHTHSLPNSGHWVHVDNPGGLLEKMAAPLAAL